MPISRTVEKDCFFPTQIRSPHAYACPKMETRGEKCPEKAISIFTFSSMVAYFVFTGRNLICMLSRAFWQSFTARGLSRAESRQSPECEKWAITREKIMMKVCFWAIFTKNSKKLMFFVEKVKLGCPTRHLAHTSDCPLVARLKRAVFFRRRYVRRTHMHAPKWKPGARSAQRKGFPDLPLVPW